MPSSKNQFKPVDDGGFTTVRVGQHEIRSHESAARTTGHNIVTIDVSQTHQIESFEPEKLLEQKGLRYSEVLKGASDPNAKKNARFRINELTRGPLSVEAEEEERIEKEVQARLESKLQEVSETVKKTAYQEGFLLGKKDANSEILAGYKPLFEKFESLIQGFETARNEIFKANEEFLIKMMYRLAKAVILRELKEDSNYTNRLVTHILDSVGTRENIKIFVGQEVYSSAEALKEGLAHSLGQLKNVSVELDSEILDRSCRVETDFGDVDARIEVQVQNIAQTLGASGS